MIEPEIGNVEDLKDARVAPVSAAPRNIVSWALLAAALLYGASPVDLLPDAIPLVGWLDDAGLVLAAALNVFQKNSADQHAFMVVFAKYAKWLVMLTTVFVVAFLGGLIMLAVWMVTELFGK